MSTNSWNSPLDAPPQVDPKNSPAGTEQASALVNAKYRWWNYYGWILLLLGFVLLAGLLTANIWFGPVDLLLFAMAPGVIGLATGGCFLAMALYYQTQLHAIRAAEELGFAWQAEGDESLLRTFGNHTLFEAGRSRSLKNVMHGMSDDLATVIWTRQYTTGSGKHSTRHTHLFVAIELPAPDFPQCEFSRRHMLGRFWNWLTGAKPALTGSGDDSAFASEFNIVASPELLEKLAGSEFVTQLRACSDLQCRAQYGWFLAWTNSNPFAMKQDKSIYLEFYARALQAFRLLRKVAQS